MCAARASWGATFTYTRMFMIRAQTYAYNAPVPMRQLLLRWTIAMPYLMRMHIEEYRVDAGNMKALLTPAEVRAGTRLLTCSGNWGSDVAGVA